MLKAEMNRFPDHLKSRVDDLSLYFGLDVFCLFEVRNLRIRQTTSPLEIRVI
jgi:hypothetical protein